MYPVAFSYDLFLSYHPMVPLEVITRGTNGFGRVKTNSLKETVYFSLLSLSIHAPNSKFCLQGFPLLIPLYHLLFYHVPFPLCD